MIYDLELAEGRFNHTASANNTLVTTSVDHWAGLTCNTSAVTCGGQESCRGFSRGAVSIMSAMLGRPEAAMANLTVSAGCRFAGLCCLLAAFSPPSHTTTTTTTTTNTTRLAHLMCAIFDGEYA